MRREEKRTEERQLRCVANARLAVKHLPLATVMSGSLARQQVKGLYRYRYRYSLYRADCLLSMPSHPVTYTLKRTSGTEHTMELDSLHCHHAKSLFCHYFNG